MCNRKMRKQKEQDMVQIELEELRKEASQLKKRLTEQKLENFKQLNIRNLRVFGNTCNFLAPFVISAGLIAGVSGLLGPGFPIYIDERTNYKAYSLDYQTNGYVTMEEYYRSNRWFDDPLPSNELIVYTPWEYHDNQYARYKREYDIGGLSTLDLFDAVLEEDYAYITENIKEYKEEIQVANSIEETEGQNYLIEASLHTLDKEDTIKYNETDLENNITTILLLVLTLAIGGKIAYHRDFEYLAELRNVNSDYHDRIQVIKQIQQELTSTNKKILSLSRKRGGKTNEK